MFMINGLNEPYRGYGLFTFIRLKLHNCPPLDTAIGRGLVDLVQGTIWHFN